jgi:hypothetical protein
MRQRCCFQKSAGLLLPRKCGLRRNPKSDGQPVVGVHQADRDRQIGQFLLGEHGRSGLEVGVWHGGVGDASDGFGPGKSGAFACVKQAAGLAPRSAGSAPPAAAAAELYSVRGPLGLVEADRVSVALDLRDVVELQQLGKLGDYLRG